MIVFVALLFIPSTKGASKEADTKTVTDEIPLIQQVKVIAPVAEPVPDLKVKPMAFIPGNCESFRSEASKYNWPVDIALKLMKKESQCDPANHNEKDNHRVCLGSWNVLNVGCVHYKKGESVDDVSLNMKKGYAIYKASGNSFRQWTTCKLVPGCK